MDPVVCVDDICMGSGVVLRDYEAVQADVELSVRQGQAVRILFDCIDGGWLDCVAFDKGDDVAPRRGLVPLSFVRWHSATDAAGNATTTTAAAAARRCHLPWWAQAPCCACA